jgi:hypothetical protein
MGSGEGITEGEAERGLLIGVLTQIIIKKNGTGYSRSRPSEGMFCTVKLKLSLGSTGTNNGALLSLMARSRGWMEISKCTLSKRRSFKCSH